MNSSTRTADAAIGLTARLALLLPALVVPVLAGLAVVERGRARLRRSGHDAGVSAVEWVLITALAVTIVAGVAVVITQKLTAKANQLDLTTP